MEKMEQLDREYVESLEMELTKMLMFERELPLSIELVSRAIESCRLKLSSTSADAGAGGFQRHLYESSSSEETAGDCDRVLQFIPIKKLSYESASESEEEKQQDLNQPCDKDGDADADKNIEKSVQRSDWLRSVQLWNQTTDLPTESEDLPEKETENVAKSAEKRSSPGQAESCSTETKDSEKSGARKKGDKEGTSQRKQRRCWSQDLHRSFLHSLQQLGGAHVATPKQIRDLMKVDGLTNDEVKSHLQKYRLHTRRPARFQEHNNGGNTQAPRFVVGGGIWAPPADSTTLAVNREANGAPKNGGLYTPMAAPAAQPHPWQEQFNQKPQNTAKNSQGHGDGLARCISPSMSSSTRTTASQVY